MSTSETTPGRKTPDDVSRGGTAASAPGTFAAGAASPKDASPPAAEAASSTAETAASPVNLEELFPDYADEAFARKAGEERKQWIGELQRAYLSQGLVLYLGAGVSMSIGLPSWNDLIHSLTVTMMSRRVKSAASALEGLKAEGRAAALNALLEEVKQRRDSQKPILMMARAIKEEMGDELTSQVALHLYGRLGGLRGVLSRWLGGVFGKALAGRTRKGDLDLPTSPLLDAVVALARPQRQVEGVHAIVNYNYDDIVEEQLRKESVPCVTIRSGKDKLPRGSLPSFHVHGVLPIRAFVDREEADAGNFVFSEDEYHTEYADSYRWSNLTQISLLGRHKGLFIGLSLQDPNLRRLIDATHEQYPGIWNYAILPRSPAPSDQDTKGIILRNLSEDVEAKTFQRIGVKVIWVDDVTKDVAPVLDQIRAIPEE